jgi:hypothetical protein
MIIAMSMGAGKDDVLEPPLRTWMSAYEAMDWRLGGGKISLYLLIVLL